MERKLRAPRKIAAKIYRKTVLVRFPESWDTGIWSDLCSASDYAFLVSGSPAHYADCRWFCIFSQGGRWGQLGRKRGMAGRRNSQIKHEISGKPSDGSNSTNCTSEMRGLGWFDWLSPFSVDLTSKQQARLGGLGGGTIGQHHSNKVS